LARLLPHHFGCPKIQNGYIKRLKREFGIVGVQLWFHANGVDESKVSILYTPQSKGLGNSQILPRNYSNKEEIEIVLREMAEQVATRIRKINRYATVVAIHIGFSSYEGKKSINTMIYRYLNLLYKNI